MLFASISLIWGVPYLFIKVAVDGGISPFFLAWVRVALAAAILCAVAPRQTRELLLRGPRRWIAAYAVVEITLPFPLKDGSKVPLVLKRKTPAPPNTTIFPSVCSATPKLP